MKLHIIASLFVLILATVISCTEEPTENQKSGSEARTPTNEMKPAPSKNKDLSTKIKQESSADIERKSKVEVPIFKNELANKLVNRLQAIQVAKLERGNIPHLQKQEEAVIMELSSISNLLIGEEKMMMSQYLAEMDIHDGHIH